MPRRSRKHTLITTGIVAKMIPGENYVGVFAYCSEPHRCDERFRTTLPSPITIVLSGWVEIEVSIIGFVLDLDILFACSRPNPPTHAEIFAIFEPLTVWRHKSGASQPRVETDVPHMLRIRHWAPYCGVASIVSLEERGRPPEKNNEKHTSDNKCHPSSRCFLLA